MASCPVVLLLLSQQCTRVGIRLVILLRDCSGADKICSPTFLLGAMENSSYGEKKCDRGAAATNSRGVMDHESTGPEL